MASDNEREGGAGDEEIEAREWEGTSQRNDEFCSFVLMAAVDGRVDGWGRRFTWMDDLRNHYVST